MSAIKYIKENLFRTKSMKAGAMPMGLLLNAQNRETVRGTGLVRTEEALGRVKPSESGARNGYYRTRTTQSVSLQASPTPLVSTLDMPERAIKEAVSSLLPLFVLQLKGSLNRLKIFRNI